MAVLRIIGRLFVLLALGLMGIGVYVWLNGRTSEPAGQVWAELHVPSLNYFQVVIERHLGLSDFWFGIVLPYLNNPAWEAILWIVIVLLVLGGILTSSGHRRSKRSNFN